MPELSLLSFLRSAAKLREVGAVGIIHKIQHINFTLGVIFDKPILTKKFSRSLNEFSDTFKSLQLNICFICQRGQTFEVHTGRVKTAKVKLGLNY